MTGHGVAFQDATLGDVVGVMRVQKLRKAYHVVRNVAYRITNLGIVIETSTRIA